MIGRLLIGLLLGLSVLASAALSRAEESKFIGTVVAADPAAGTVSVAESHGAGAMDFLVDGKSRLTAGASRTSLKLADVAVGSSVSVTYEPAGSEGELPRVRHMQITSPRSSDASQESP